MANITFITGNQKKVDYLTKYFGYPFDHVKLDLDEIQSLDLKKIVEHKACQAYEKIKKPVIVEDVALEFAALGGLPGPFIRFFVDRVQFETMCSMLAGNTREAIARSVLGYFDGKDLKLFEGSLEGQIAEKPSGANGYGWDRIFIPKGYSATRASLNEKEYQETYLQIKSLAKLKEYLKSKLRSPADKELRALMND